MAEIVNLKRVRKRKEREDADALAAQNRAKFGRTKAQKAHDAAIEKAARDKLDALRRDAPDDDPPGGGGA